ncbi:MAG: 30S ribosomal protein S15 [Planctomycetota bacterium]|nr:30S ribosomal protein S15 [Planctomycetota bacterium]
MSSAEVIDKKTVVQKYRRHETDTGSAEVQVALQTARINHLTEHMKTHTKDFASRRGLLRLVGMRSSLLKYLATQDPARYQDIIKALGLRK